MNASTTRAAVLAALLLGIASITHAAEPVKVFILTGQSNMVGQAKVSLLEYQAEAPETKERFAHLRKEGQWVVRDDVWIRFGDRCGGLTVGYGGRDRIGPELECGHVLGDHYDAPVLLIKTAWGGKSLYVDFRPPSAGLPPKEVLEKTLQGMRNRNPGATLADVEAQFGAYYRQMLSEVKETLDEFDERFPQWKGRGYELCGVVWFQGWNDMINADYTAEYAENMAHFIRDIRNDLGAADLPFVIGQMGVDGKKGDENPKMRAFKEAQAAPAELPEFHGSVAVVRTDALWDETAAAVFAKGWKEHADEWNKVGSDFAYHYLGSAKCYCDIGRAFGEALLKLQKEQ